MKPTLSILRPRHLLTALVTGLLSACGGTHSPLGSVDDWTFVNYWAQWCKPCIREIPELNTLHGEDGYTVLGVNYDGAQGEELARQVQTLGVAFPTLAEDPAEILGTERPAVLPTTLVLAPGGKLHQVLVGPQTVESLREATR